ncbi:hypothetical protein D3C76_1604500 [compost metagenome]
MSWACIMIKAISIASAKVSPPIPKPLVTVRITGLAMITPTELANVVGNPTLPRSSWALSRDDRFMVISSYSGFYPVL